MYSNGKSKWGGGSEWAAGFRCKEPRDDRAGDISEGDDLGQEWAHNGADFRMVGPQNDGNGADPHGGWLLRKVMYIGGGRKKGGLSRVAANERERDTNR